MYSSKLLHADMSHAGSSHDAASICLVATVQLQGNVTLARKFLSSKQHYSIELRVLKHSQRVK